MFSQVDKTEVGSPGHSISDNSETGLMGEGCWWGVRICRRFCNKGQAGRAAEDCYCCVTESCPTLQPHELQRARLPCPSLSPGVCSYLRPLSWWCHPTISSSVTAVSSCPQSFPTSASFPNESDIQIKRLLLIKESQRLQGMKRFLLLGKVQESGLTETLLWCTSQRSGTSVLCFLILSLLRVHHGWVAAESDGDEGVLILFWVSSCALSGPL